MKESMSLLGKIAPLVESLDLKISDVQITRTFFPFIHHIECEISPKEGLSCVGRGMALDEVSAFNKAIGEALERYCFRTDGQFQNTNGIALHTQREIAQQKAQFELLERDSYLCHFYTQTPFFAYEDKDLCGSLYHGMCESLWREGVKLIVGRLSSREGLFISVAICIGVKDDLDFGLKVGLGCSESIGESVNSAVLEAMNCLPRIFNGAVFPKVSLEEFYAKEVLYPRDFDALANNKSSIEIMRPLLELNKVFRPSTFSPEITFRDLLIPDVLNSCFARV